MKRFLAQTVVWYNNHNQNSGVIVCPCRCVSQINQLPHTYLQGTYILNRTVDELLCFRMISFCYASYLDYVKNTNIFRSWWKTLTQVSFNLGFAFFVNEFSPRCYKFITEFTWPMKIGTEIHSTRQPFYGRKLIIIDFARKTGYSAQLRLESNNPCYKHGWNLQSLKLSVDLLLKPKWKKGDNCVMWTLKENWQLTTVEEQQNSDKTGTLNTLNWDIILTFSLKLKMWQHQVCNNKIP